MKIVTFINLFFPSFISIHIYHNQIKSQKWTVEDVVVYGIFVVLNMFASKLIISLIQIFTNQIEFPIGGINYTGIALIVSIFLAYGRTVINSVFHGKVEVTKK